MKNIRPYIGAGLSVLTLLAAFATPARAQQEPADVATPKLGKDGKVDAEFAQKHAQFVQTAQQGNVGILLLGDSITAGWFWGKNREIYDAHFGKFNPANFGIGGDRTEHVLWRIDNGELDGLHPKVVILLIGTNNIGYPAEDIIKGDEKIVEEIHQKLPDSKLLLNAIFPRGNDPKDPQVAEMRAKIKTVNESLAKLDDGNKTRYLDLGPKLLTPDGTLTKDVTFDYLHLNYKGYQIWADAMQPMLDDMLK